jgi:hypothetical protein
LTAAILFMNSVHDASPAPAARSPTTFAAEISMPP